MLHSLLALLLLSAKPVSLPPSGASFFNWALTAQQPPFLVQTIAREAVPSLYPSLLQSDVDTTANPLFEYTVTPVDPNTASSVPSRDPSMLGVQLNAQESIAIDRTTGAVLWQHNAATQRPIASLTKLMTAVVALQNASLTDIITVSDHASKMAIDGSRVDLVPDEQMKLGDMLYGALVGSGNDAATAIAENVGGSEEGFVAMMNQEARTLDMRNTHFANPTGLDEDGNYSTALDLAKLVNAALSTYPISDIVASKTADISSIDGAHRHQFENTNELLNSYLHVTGVKTGFTDDAGECLITLAHNDQGQEIITVILGSPDRVRDSKALIDWVFRAYTWNTNN